MKLIRVLLIAIVFVSCKSEPKVDGYQIEVNAPGVYNGIRAYIMSVDERGRQIPVDTAIVMNEKLTFTGKTDNPGQYVLKVDNLPRPFGFLLSNEVFTINLNKENISTTEIKGSKANDLFNGFNEGLKTIVEDLQSLSDQRRLAVYQKDTAKANTIEKQLKEEQTKVVNYGLDFINKNSNSVVSLVLLEQQLTTRGIEVEKVSETFDGLSAELKNSNKGKALENTINILVEEAKKEAKLAIGAKAPNFSAPTAEGEMVSLNDLKGKVTIIDFWAAWCGPCRMENPNVVKVYNQYHDKGLEIIGVSLDGQSRQKNPKEEWLRAIKKDGLTWHHVSHLKYFNDPVAKEYNIKSIPATYILDETGTIVAKNLRGIALENKIKELLEDS